MPPSSSDLVASGTSVLVDNTTVHGAVAALSEWPPSAAAWTSHPYAANLRSLMDMIEAMILFERISLDSACRTLAPPSSDESVVPYVSDWEPFRTLYDQSTAENIFALEPFSNETRVIAGGIFATAAEELKASIRCWGN